MTTKICTKCNTEKELRLFCRKQSSKDKLRSECKSCEKDYRSRNKDKIIKNKKIYRLLEEKIQNTDKMKNINIILNDKEAVEGCLNLALEILDSKGENYENLSAGF